VWTWSWNEDLFIHRPANRIFHVHHFQILLAKADNSIGGIFMTLHSPFILLKVQEYLKFSLVSIDLIGQVFNDLNEMPKISDTGTSPAQVRS
jgi:hypothetical protein